MRRIQIGKDISCVWRVKTNGQSESLEGRDIKLFIIDPKRIGTELSFTAEGDALHFLVPHSIQIFTGIYGLQVWENRGQENQTTTDLRDAFCLVEHADMEDEGSASDITAATIDLGTASLAVGVGGDICEKGYTKIYTNFYRYGDLIGVWLFFKEGQKFSLNISGQACCMIRPNDTPAAGFGNITIDVTADMDGYYFFGTNNGTAPTQIKIITNIGDQLINEEIGKCAIIDTTSAQFDINIASTKTANLSDVDYYKIIKCAKAGYPVRLRSKCYLRGGTYITNIDLATSIQSASDLHFVGLVNVASTIFRVSGSLVSTASSKKISATFTQI